MEQYDVAAVRHMKTAEYLEAGGHMEDAGYHFGVSAENAVKSAMREAGLEQYWRSLGRKRFGQCPMVGHWAKLGDKMKAAAGEVALYANGRRSNALKALAPMADTLFQDWSIDIRYADVRNVPLQAGQLTRWRADAVSFVTSFVVV